MIRMLLASTAVAAVLATGALAQDASSSTMDSSMMDSSAMSSQMTDASSMDSSMMDSSMVSSEPMDSSMASSAPMDTTTTAVQPRTPVDILSGYTRADTDQLASKIIGSPVYDGTAADANNLGNIKDLVLDRNGNIAAVVLGVGGFLGLGEKQVAVDYSALQWTVAADNTERFVLKTTKDDLTNAPDFKSVDDQPGQSSAADDTMSSVAPDAKASSSAM